MMYSSVLLLLAFVASVSYRPANSTASTGSLGSVETTSDTSKPSVDQIAAAGLVAKTAQVANLSIADDASNAAITMTIKSELAQQDAVVITKPQTFEPTSSSAIVTYKAAAGDTAQTIATKYGVSSQTIRWANNLTTDLVAAGSDVVVPTVDGVVYVTKAGDTADSIAQKYQSDAARIVSKNDLELTGIVAGQRIVLPGGVLPENERPGYISPRSRLTATASSAVRNVLYTVQAGNRYTYGTCTWYVYNRRMELGRPMGSLWGNANMWAFSARSAGYTVTIGSPQAGDIMQTSAGRYGHVSIVEEVRADGSILISEMNWFGDSIENRNGWGIVSHRILDAGAAAGYTFIK